MVIFVFIIACIAFIYYNKIEVIHERYIQKVFQVSQHYRVCFLPRFDGTVSAPQNQLTEASIMFPRVLAFLVQYQPSSVPARICDSVPNRWNSMAMNWISRITANDSRNTIPIGSSSRYSRTIKIWREIQTIKQL